MIKEVREIKFRLRDKDNNIVGYEKWYCGHYLKEEKRYEANPLWLYSTDNKYWTPNYIEHRFKDQFTGLPDKFKKEIYKGDILESEKKIYEVYWDKDDAHFSPLSEHIDNRYTEVIGNMWENKDLLK